METSKKPSAITKNSQGVRSKTVPYSQQFRQPNTTNTKKDSTTTGGSKVKGVSDHLENNLSSLRKLLDDPLFGVGESPEARAVIEMFEFALREIKDLKRRVKILEGRKDGKPTDPAK